ncbi:hypothetical protein SAFG77S_12229 [Streptomyces afghaniensis]
MARRLTVKATVSWRDPTPRDQTAIPGETSGEKDLSGLAQSTAPPMLFRTFGRYAMHCGFLA